MNTGLHKKLLRRVILVIFLSIIAIPASIKDIYSLDNGKGWIAFERGQPEAIGLKDRALSREEIRQRRVRADKTQFSKGRFTSELRLKLDFPGAFLTQPDDNGLLAGRYDLLSLLPGKKAQTLTVNGSLQPDKLGKPNLAYVRLKVRLPYPVDKKDLSISVINADYIQLDGSYDIAPVQEELPESFRPGIDKDHRKFQMEEKVYKADKFFSPPLEYELITFHGVKIAEISFSPLQYNPVRKILKACPSAELLIRYNVGTENDIPSSVPTTLVDGIIETFCFDGSSSSSPSDSQIMQMSALTESTGRFVIVSHSDLINTYTYDDYITYREDQGYVHLETIDTASTLFDEPSEIRNRLLELYQDPGFDYLLLIGDETLVPISHEDENGYHDKMYSRLDGDDAMPDVFMGRFLADNETGFRNILDHQIGQENSEFAMNEVMMTWGIEHYGRDPDLADRFSCSHYSTLIMDNPDGGLGYNVHRYYKTETLSIPGRYGGIHSFCGIPVSEFEPWTLIPSPFYIDSSECTNAIIDRWNQGVAVIGHCDHGSTSGPSSPYIPYSIFSGQITSSSFPLFTSTNCSTGNFKEHHDDNFAYQSQVNTFGTCATFAATKITYSGDNDYYHLAMYDAMFPDDGQLPSRNVGEIFLAGLLGSSQNHSRTYYHIFGDPMTTLTLGLPSGIEFNISFPQKGSYMGDIVNVTGTVSGDEFESYELYYWNEETPENRTLISSSSSPVIEDVLVVWDTTLYPEGRYILGLKVTTNTDNYFWFYGGVIIDNYNEPPLFEQMADKIVFIREDLSFVVEVIDPDDPQTPEGTLTYSVEGLPEGASYDNATQTFSWTPQESDLYKTYTVTFQVSDSEYTVSQELDIHVLELVQVTSAPSSQRYPRIYENNIVWDDDRDGNWDIYLYDLGKDGIYGTGDDRGEFRVASDPSYQYCPVIYENKIVWYDDRNGNKDIYLYDLGGDRIYGTGDDRGEFQVTSDPSDQWQPVIYENKIVWYDNRNGNSDVYLYDLGDDGIYGTGDDRGEFQVTSDLSSQVSPVIYENKIVWQDNRNWDICLYDLGDDGIYGTGDDRGEFQVTSDLSRQMRPAIYENNIVWYDYRNGNYDIYLYDLGEDGMYGTGDDRGEFQVTSDPSDQWPPVIYKNKIVWHDYRNGNWDIYLYDLGGDGIYGTADDKGEFQITRDPLSQSPPVIYENKIVWEDNRNGNGDIYMTTLNQVPIFYPIGDKEVNQGELLEFTVTATDPDGAPLVYSASNLPGGATFVGQTFSWTPDYTQAGTYSGVTFTVSDGSLTDSEIITITVNNVNQAPSVGTVTPSSGNSNPGQVVTFTTTYTDLDGWEQIRYGYFLVNDRVSVRNCCFVQYDQNTNKLYLRDENHTVWLGGYEPGSENTIENSYVELHCADTSVSGADNTLTVTWGIAFKPAFRGNKKTYLYVTDDSGMSGGWWTQVGTWTINNQAPSVGTVTPLSGSSNPGEVATFTTTYTDLDGWEQIRYGYFLVNDRVVIRDCCFACYDQNTNKLYLRDDNHTVWLGGYEPGSENTIENSYVELRCADTSVSGADNTLTVTWSIVFKPTFRGNKKTYLYVTDDSGMSGGWWTQVGTWTIK